MKLLIRNTLPVAFVADTVAPGSDEFLVPVLPRLRLIDYTPAILTNLIDRDHGPKAAARFRIKAEAVQRIEALQWRIERARERETIGAGGETVADVMREREAVRRASNRAEAHIDALEDEGEVRQYRLQILPEDYPAPVTLTRLQFMRRFTDQERADIRAARDSGQSQDLLDFWELLQLATGVNLNDPDIQAGVQMLEAAGLIGEGRANEVVAV